MGVGSGLYLYDVVRKTLTFAISSSDELLYMHVSVDYVAAVACKWRYPPFVTLIFKKKFLARYGRCENAT